MRIVHSTTQQDSSIKASDMIDGRLYVLKDAAADAPPYMRMGAMVYLVGDHKLARTQSKWTSSPVEELRTQRFLAVDTLTLTYAK